MSVEIEVSFELAYEISRIAKTYKVGTVEAADIMARAWYGARTLQPRLIDFQDFASRRRTLLIAASSPKRKARNKRD